MSADTVSIVSWVYFYSCLCAWLKPIFANNDLLLCDGLWMVNKIHPDLGNPPVEVAILRLVCDLQSFLLQQFVLRILSKHMFQYTDFTPRAKT